jgi:putative protease
MRGHSESTRQQYVGNIVHWENGMAEIEVKNRFSVGDKLEVIHPSGNQIVDLSEMRAMNGDTLTVAPGSGHRVRIPLAGNVEKGMIARFI